MPINGHLITKSQSFLWSLFGYFSYFPHYLSSAEKEKESIIYLDNEHWDKHWDTTRQYDPSFNEVIRKQTAFIHKSSKLIILEKFYSFLMGLGNLLAMTSSDFSQACFGTIFVHGYCITIFMLTRVLGVREGIDIVSSPCSNSLLRFES